MSVNRKFLFRYIVAEILPFDPNDSTKSIGSGKLTDCLMKNIQKYYGDYGLASVSNGLKVQYCNDKTLMCILRARHGPHRFLSSCLPLITVVRKLQDS